MNRPAHSEHHAIHRSGWLRAAVLGANDGLVSTGSLLVGIAAANADKNILLMTGAAALVAGAMSMAAGEYVSVSSQADIERADLNMERKAIASSPEAERAELAAIYEARGVSEETAADVAAQLMAHDALGAHAQDELGILEHTNARPLQAAFASALSFAAGAGIPLAAAIAAPHSMLAPVIVTASLLGLTLLGAASAVAGGAPKTRAILRIVLWGAAAMAITAGAGKLFGAVL